MSIGDSVISTRPDLPASTTTSWLALMNPGGSSTAMVWRPGFAVGPDPGCVVSAFAVDSDVLSPPPPRLSASRPPTTSTATPPIAAYIAVFGFLATMLDPNEAIGSNGSAFDTGAADTSRS